MADNPDQETRAGAAPASRGNAGVTRRRSTPRGSGHPPSVPGRAAALKVDEASHITLKMPLLGSVRLPEPQRLTYYAAIGALGVLGILEWPVALVLAGGHALASDQHNRAVQQFGDALEDA